MIYINISNWKNPIFRIIKSKKEDIKFNKTKEIIDSIEITEPSTKVVYDLVGNKLVSRIETSKTYKHSNITYKDYVALSIEKHANYNLFLE